jgi:hypothetical protein
MKNVAKCDTWCELQNPVNHRVFERKLRPKPLGRGHVCLGVTHLVTAPIQAFRLGSLSWADSWARNGARWMLASRSRSGADGLNSSPRTRDVTTKGG